MALDILRGPNSLPVASIRTDGGTQARLRINEETVDEYAEALVGGAVFPPVIVYYDGEHYWLADGFHRLAAYKQSEYDNSIMADIRQGTRRDAVLCAVGSNASHGLRRTNEDKRNAVLTLLRDEEWGKWSDREIARVAQVSNNLVSTLRRSLSSNDSEAAERTYTTKHGTTATMQTANIGKSATSAPPAKPTGRCGKCGRELTDPAAIAAGVGACCARNLAAGDVEESGPPLTTTARIGEITRLQLLHTRLSSVILALDERPQETADDYGIGQDLHEIIVRATTLRAIVEQKRPEDKIGGAR